MARPPVFPAEEITIAEAAPAAPAPPGIACALASSGQDPSSTDPWRADQPLRTRSLKPLIRRLAEFWNPAGYPPTS